MIYQLHWCVFIIFSGLCFTHSVAYQKLLSSLKSEDLQGPIPSSLLVKTLNETEMAMTHTVNHDPDLRIVMTSFVSGISICQLCALIAWWCKIKLSSFIWENMMIIKKTHQKSSLMSSSWMVAKKIFLGIVELKRSNHMDSRKK